MTVANQVQRPPKAEKIMGTSSLNEKKRIRKKCFGCGDNFICSPSENFDYCRNCEINSKRHILKENRCSECGDGSGIIQFPNQPPRPCKLCSLTKPLLQHETRTK